MLYRHTAAPDKSVEIEAHHTNHRARPGSQYHLELVQLVGSKDGRLKPSCDP